jgi:hypothetical protein
MKTKMKKINSYHTYIPSFPGFYETILERCDYDDEGYEVELDISVDDLQNYYDDVGNLFLELYVKRFEKELKDIDISFEGIYCPREYNYMNDELQVLVTSSLTDDEVKNVFKKLDKNRDVVDDILMDCYEAR